uniref:Immunoglobulin superfamily containing leucine-rich repeat protein 2-like n=1 Tax=Sinocyclocheilus anshuiensis TaxID=1608454 RepID=A0A671MZ61_9TELE
MATRYLMLIALGTAVIGSARGCPEQCKCTGKVSLQLTDCAYKDLLEVPEGLPSNVTTLSLSANKIKVLKSKNFINVTQVTSLWLAHNEIVTVERGTFAPLIQLKNLDISHNKIVHFPWEDLTNLTALHLLKMNNNDMVSIPKDTFSKLKELRSVRINNNKFTTIVQGTFDALISMSHLQIFHNPFTCSCNLEWLRDWINKSSISIPEQNNIVCDAPSHLKGTQVTSMPKLDCKAPSVSITYQPNIEKNELNEGYMVMLYCETKGTPKPEVTWEIYAGNQLITFPLPAIVEKIEIPINGPPTNARFLVASFVGSEKNFNPSELEEGEGEADGGEGDGEGEDVEGSVVTESIPESQSKTQEEFEVGSEYSDRLPLGAEAVNISAEINGNYKQPR